MATFSERFKQLRNELGLTQEQIGNDFGVGKSNICRYESGKQVPEFKNLEAFANYFKVTADYLLGRTDDRNVVVLEGKKLPPPLQGIIDAIGIAKGAGLSEEDIKQLIDIHAKMQTPKNS